MRANLPSEGYGIGAAEPIRGPMLVRLVTVLASLALLTGCSTEEGRRAQELLKQAETAQAQLRTSTFDGSMSISFDGATIGMQFHGATSPQGEWFSLQTSGVPGGGDMAMQVLNRNGHVTVNTGGGWQAAPAGAAGSNGTMSAEAFQQLAQYVTDVRVNEHQLIGGKPVTTIAGEIDTQGMLEAALKLGSLAPSGGFDVSDAGIDFGDIHAVLTIDERTKLLDTAFVSFSMSAEGKSAKIELRYRLASANQPVKLPQP
jgi:hypothetical protein